MPGRGLGHAEQAHREHHRDVLVQLGVLPDDSGDHLRAGLVGALHPGGGLGDVGQVGLEDQPERAGLVGDEVEVRLEGRADALAVVGGGVQGHAHAVDQRVAALVEDREVQLELAWEVLVEHRLGDPGELGDRIHAGGVVPLRDEGLARGVEQLRTPLLARQAPRAIRDD